MLVVTSQNTGAKMKFQHLAKEKDDFIITFSSCKIKGIGLKTGGFFLCEADLKVSSPELLSHNAQSGIS